MLNMIKERNCAADRVMILAAVVSKRKNRELVSADVQSLNESFINTELFSMRLFILSHNLYVLFLLLYFMIHFVNRFSTTASLAVPDMKINYMN